MRSAGQAEREKRAKRYLQSRYRARAFRGSAPPVASRRDRHLL